MITGQVHVAQRVSAELAARRAAGFVLPVQVRLLVVHQMAPTLQQVRPGVGRLDNFARVIGLL